MAEMHDGFTFVDAGRTFTCCVETPRRPRAEAWWWFQISTDDRQRYAPFRAETSDTPDAVQQRILSYYAELLARRAEPARPRWQRRAAPVAVAAEST